jgi:splicing factor 45
MFKPTNLGGKKPNQPKAKSKPNFSAMHKFSSTAAESVSTPAAAAPRAEDSSPPSHALQQPGAQPRLVQKRGFSDWLANEDEEDFLYDRSRQERDGRRNKKKKKKQQQQQEQTWSWDDIYDPTLPVPFLEYPRSDARYDLNEEWKQRLYEAHKWERRRQGKEINRDSSEGDSYSMLN